MINATLSRPGEDALALKGPVRKTLPEDVAEICAIDI
jgi:hypothetical protein